jgi:DNA-binding NtrC family response regulator
MSGVNRKLRVLVAEDDDALRELVRAHLEDTGFQVDLVGDGQSLKAFLLAQVPPGAMPDVVLLDVRMFGWTGLEALRWLSIHHPEIPVLLMSAFADATLHDAARRMGAVAFFDKPVNLDVLRDTIAGMGRARAALAEARRKLEQP